jgi:hypothetical protein
LYLNKIKNNIMTKIVEFTGSPKSSGFKTKDSFLKALTPYGFEHGKMTKKGNVVDILCCDSPESGSLKLQLADDLGVQIMTYIEMVDMFDLEGDM